MLRETLQSSSAWHQGDGGDVDDDDYVNEEDDGDDDDTAVLKCLAPR